MELQVFPNGIAKLPIPSRLAGLKSAVNPDEALTRGQLEVAGTGNAINLVNVTVATTGAIATSAVISTTLTTESTSSTTGALKSAGGLGVAKSIFAGLSINSATQVIRPVGTTVVANTGTTLTAAMMVSGYVEVTGTTGSLALDTPANITLALGTTPAGTTFEFTLNTKGATPMTATNVVTLTAPANCIFMKQFNSTDVGSAFIPTVTATDGIHVGVFRVTYQTATTIVVQRIG